MLLQSVIVHKLYRRTGNFLYTLFLFFFVFFVFLPWVGTTETMCALHHFGILIIDLRVKHQKVVIAEGVYLMHLSYLACSRSRK